VSDLLFTSSAGPGTHPAPRRRRSGRGRAARALAVLLILTGSLVLADVVVTLVWQEPLSALYAALRQDHLNGALRRVERAAPSPAEQRTLASIADERRRISYLAGELERHAGDGSPVGRIVIPRIGASFVVVNGTNTEDLKSGPGIYPETSFPGAGRTTAIAGHRTTYLAPFRNIDALSHGSVIRMEMPYAEFTYSVIGQRVVEPTDVQAAVADVGYGRLVLSACTPLFSAAKRLLVFARLERTVPRGAARTLPGGALPQPIEAHPSQHGAGARRPLPAVLESLDPHVFSPGT
jgi:sortase A